MYTVSPEEALRRVATAETWSQFCKMLKSAGNVITRPGTPDDALTRAEGLRYLSRVARAALEAFVEHADPGAPVLRRVVHETAKLGADNPDSYYLNAELDGAAEYVLSGRRNTVHFIEFATQIGSYGESRGMAPAGHLDGQELALDADGRFEIVLSPERKGRNWLRTTPDTRTLIIRQNRLRVETEELAELHLARVDGAGPSPLTPERVDVGLMKAGLLVFTAPMMFCEWVEGFQKHLNQLPRFDQATSDRMGGVPFIRYHHSAWRLAANEALVVRIPAWACDHWNVVVGNHWMESLDYRYHHIHTNSGTAHLDADGTATVVIAHADPGHPNWLRTDGHLHGTLCFRWVRPEPFDAPDPVCEVVELAAWRRG